MDLSPEKIFFAGWWYVVFLFSTVCHEAAHALAGRRLGDATAERFLTLDPLPHIKRTPFGMVVIPWLTYAMFGFMLGFASVPCDPLWARRYPKKSALMSLAGPAANLALFLIFYGALWAFYFYAQSADLEAATIRQIARALDVGLFLNLLYLAFNTLPVPPLDGSAIPLLFLSPRQSEKYQNIINGQGAAFCGLFMAWFIFSDFFDATWGRLANLLPFPF
jgi:Zn-dependent protease